MMKRRNFVKTTAMAASALSLFPADLSAIDRIMPAGGKLEKRSLGRTGEKLSVIGFGGILVMDEEPADAAGLVRLAVEAGVNHFDVAPSYGDAEIKLGPALEPFRKQVFLSCKTLERKKEGARKELEQSLKNLRTDHFDLYQLHSMTTPEDVKTVLGKGGALETFIEARKEGKIRFIGFSAHSEEAAMELMKNFDFDTIMMPVNYAVWHSGNFGSHALEMARQKKMGIIALKAMAKGPWPTDADRSKYKKCWYEPFTVEEDIRMSLRFTLSHPVTDAITPGEPELFRLALGLRDRLQPLKKKEVGGMKILASGVKPLFRYPSWQQG